MPYLDFKMPVVFVVSPEWDLRGAVRAELREAGIEALGMETVSEMGRAIAGGLEPSPLVLDGALLHESGAQEALRNVASRLTLLVVDSRLIPAPVVPGAEVMFKPIQVQQIVQRVLALLAKSHNRSA